MNIIIKDGMRYFNDCLCDLITQGGWPDRSHSFFQKPDIRQLIKDEQHYERDDL